ncbi:hypothetical protein Psed_0032 [Pseudonocardia dioxanivorans CB1190]|uniref:DUF4913 domain-containing protein n=1 Tax=Pseudonocardia dioxanivorans (strain ATCC 55486 / DSM 44775 / JCM 13855 / CB1190) TaxID=675635 RepID=F4CK91_PSEUX|nr:hypothetical protein [Pseudonocardia dioxanivorans]AEA22314.1 hypothetical protein Psed_0032 [Pseudonocardia dioxanivorans CB1190]
MTSNNTPPSANEDGWVGPLAGLARLVDGLRRDIDPLTPLPQRVEELAEVLARLSETVASIANRRNAGPAPSWLLAPESAEDTATLLDELSGWMAAIYLRYPDGVATLPDCWLWHPDVIEELVWLMHAWSAAYQGPAASVALAGDWHDRQRPGVVRRIRQAVGSCSRERHRDRPGRPPLHTGRPALAGAEQLREIAAWWAIGRDATPPEPAQLDSEGAWT